MTQAQEESAPQLLWASVLDSVPSSPGVYWFLDSSNHVIYVGKAKDLHKRVSSYTRVTTHNTKTLAMVTEAALLKWSELSSELEALLVEAELIHAHQPHYNMLLKDDKSPLYIVITDEPFHACLQHIKEK